MPEEEYDFVGQQRLTDSDLVEAARATNEYSVSLVNGNSLIGSGTLVQIGHACGILTADHVWQAVRRGEAKDHFCVVLGAELQRFEYSFQECTPLIVGDYSSQHAAEGPDLAFIRLHNLLKLGTIRSRKSFFRLEAHKAKMLDQIPVERCPWLVWGAPYEKSRRFSTKPGEPILKITHFAGASEFVEKIDREGFDYVKVRIPAGDGNFPSRYGGVSGGGVWIPFRFSKDSKGQALKTNISLLLAGVAYYEISEEPNYMTLLLHGPKSIYGRAIDAVLRHYP